MNWIWTNMCKSTTEKVPIACCKAPKSNEIAQINFLKRENSNVYKFCIAKTRTRIDGILCIYQNSIVRTHNKTQCLANKSSIFHLLQKFCLRINCTSISLHSVGLDEFSYCCAANFCGLFWSSQLKLLFGFAEYTCFHIWSDANIPWMREKERDAWFQVFAHPQEQNQWISVHIKFHITFSHHCNSVSLNLIWRCFRLEYCAWVRLPYQSHTLTLTLSCVISCAVCGVCVLECCAM